MSGLGSFGWADLSGGENSCEFAEEEACLLSYMGKMVELKNKRKGLHAKAAEMRAGNEAFDRLYKASYAACPETSSTSRHVSGTLA